MANALLHARKVIAMAAAAASFVLLLSGASVLRAVPGNPVSGQTGTGCPVSGPWSSLEPAPGGE